MFSNLEYSSTFSGLQENFRKKHKYGTSCCPIFIRNWRT